MVMRNIVKFAVRHMSPHARGVASSHDAGKLRRESIGIMTRGLGSDEKRNVLW